MKKAIFTAILLLIITVCLAIATLAAKPTGHDCTDIPVSHKDWDAWQNLSGSGEMLETQKVRCNGGQQGKH